MISAYIDTSAILATYIPNDPHSASCRKFFEETEIEKLASSLSMLELSCIFSRLLEANEVEVPPQIEALLKELSNEENVQALVEYAITNCKLRIVDVDPIPMTVSLIGSPIKISHIYLKALELASKLRLKTLNTLHLAHILCLKDEGMQIEYLVTDDKEILARGDRISGMLKSRVLSSEETFTL